MNSKKENLFFKGVILFAIFVFACLCVNCFYTFPEGDIYITAYLNSGKTALDIQKFFYFNWSGRIAANMFAVLSQFYLNYPFAYQLSAFLLLIFVSITIFGFIHHCFSFQKKTHQYFITAVLFLSILQVLNSTASAFYWLPASVCYILPLCIAFWSSIAFYKAKNALTIALSCLGLFYTTLFNEILTLVMLLAYTFILFKRNVLPLPPFKFFLALFVLIVGSIFLFVAPGNFVRKAYVPETLNFVEVIFYANKALFLDIYQWLSISPLILFLIICFYFLNIKITVKNTLIKVINHSIWQTTITIYLILLVGYAIIYKLGGEHPPERILNVIGITFTLIIFILVFTFNNEQTIAANNKALNLGILITTILVIFNLNHKKFNISNIITDATSGRGKKYHLAMQKQFFTLQNSSNSIVNINEVIPAPSISFCVLSHDTSKLIYQQSCAYFNKRKINVEQ